MGNVCRISPFFGGRASKRSFCSHSLVHAARLLDLKAFSDPVLHHSSDVRGGSEKRDDDAFFAVRGRTHRRSEEQNISERRDEAGYKEPWVLAPNLEKGTNKSTSEIQTLISPTFLH